MGEKHKRGAPSLHSFIMREAASTGQLKDKPTKAQKLADALTKALGHPVAAKNLFGARGYYRHRRADVMPWTGVVQVDGMPRTLGCWRTMTACLKHGFAVTDDRGVFRAYSDYDVLPFDEGSGLDPLDGPISREVGRWMPAGRASLKEDGR
jgi:hypothetical protein